MRRLCAALLVTAFAAMSAMPAMAQVIDDPLHGYFPGFVDNGTNTPTTTNPITNFGFTVSPGPASGDFVLDVLVPNTVATPGGISFSVTGTLTGTASLFNSTAWTSGNLAGYLGITASPDNKIGAYLPSTQVLDPGATGFFVYQVDLGSTTLQDASNPNSSPILSITQGLPLASYIVGFLNEGGTTGWVATANSGALFETGSPPPPPGPNGVPEPSTMLIAAVGALGFLGYGLRRRRKS